jgi:2-dehydro-3-deoxygalactonokinase
MAEPSTITGRLFGLRAQSLVADTSNVGAAARLSGYLIGLELASTRAYWQGAKVSIIGASALAQHYQRALGLAGVSAQMLDTELMTLAGLTAAYAAYKDETDVR